MKHQQWFTLLVSLVFLLWGVAVAICWFRMIRRAHQLRRHAFSPFDISAEEKKLTRKYLKEASLCTLVMLLIMFALYFFTWIGSPAAGNNIK